MENTDTGEIESVSSAAQGCTPRPAPPRPRGKWLPRAAPAPGEMASEGIYLNNLQ